MKVSLVTTIYNEEQTIEGFLESIGQQTVLPDEVIVVDGGSTDKTMGRIKSYKLRMKSEGRKLDLKVFVKKGNRSVGRNEGILRAANEIILFSDAGCLLDKNWVKEIVKPFIDHSTEVVAGYYEARTETVFQKCLAPYALTMPDKVNPKSFLPATRSMAIRKKVFEEMKGFDVRYSHNEDYVFARKLRLEGRTIIFVPTAVVYWIPRRTFKEAYIMFWRFAYGDAEAGIVRPKVVLLFLRYILGVLLMIIVLVTSNVLLLFFLLFAGLLYGLWAIWKSIRYVNDWRAIYFLPLIQFTADLAVMKGSFDGFFSQNRKKL